MILSQHIIFFTEGVLVQDMVMEFGNFLNIAKPGLSFPATEEAQTKILQWIRGEIDEKTTFSAVAALSGIEPEVIGSSFAQRLAVNAEMLSFIDSLATSYSPFVLQDLPDLLWNRIAATIREKGIRAGLITGIPANVQGLVSFLLYKGFNRNDTLLLCWNSITAADLVVQGWKTILYTDLWRLVRELRLQGVL